MKQINTFLRSSILAGQTIECKDIKPGYIYVIYTDSIREYKCIQIGTTRYYSRSVVTGSNSYGALNNTARYMRGYEEVTEEEIANVAAYLERNPELK